MGLFVVASNKETAMLELRERSGEIGPNVCGIGHSTVWGEGSVRAKIAIVGEAPGDKEEKLRRPFVGPAGSILNHELEAAGIHRSDVWITNVVKCRPTREADGRLNNRPPTAKEVREWTGILGAELAIVAPRVIVCLGAVAANTLIHKDFRITQVRGKWFQSILGPRAIATYHPAYLLRQVDENWETAMEEFRRDLRSVAESLQQAV